jgi:hypothetical protein
VDVASQGEEAVGESSPRHDSLGREYETDETGSKGRIKGKLKGLQG